MHIGKWPVTLLDVLHISVSLLHQAGQQSMLPSNTRVACSTLCMLNCLLFPEGLLTARCACRLAK